MDPPELLIPLQLLDGVAFDIFEVKNTTMFFVPTKFCYFEKSLFTFFNELSIVVANCKINQKPHRFISMAGIDDPTFVTVTKLAILSNILQNDTFFLVDEIIENVIN